MRRVDQGANLYAIRIGGHLGPTTLAAFPAMMSPAPGRETLLTGVVDRSGLDGVLLKLRHSAWT